MAADPEPCDVILIPLADGPVCGPDADGIDVFGPADALEAQAVVPRILLEKPVCPLRSTPRLFRQRRQFSGNAAN